MKVLQVGIFNDHELGGCLVFEKGLKENGYEVVRFPYRDIFEEKGSEFLNEEIIRQSNDIDLLFIGKGEHIHRNALQIIRKKGIPILLWYGDMRPEPEEWLIRNLDQVDAFFLSSGGEKLGQYYNLGKPGVAAYYFNPSCPSVIPSKAPRKEYNIGITATGYGFADQERYDIIKYLNKRRDVEFRGGGERIILKNSAPWKRKMVRLTDRLGITEKSQKVRGQEYIDFIQRCKIGIGVNAFQDIFKYTSDRLIHFVQMGTFYLPFYFPGLENLFPSDEIDSFKNIPELKEKLVYYLKHDNIRNTMAQKAQQRAIDSYNTKNITAMMIEILYKGKSDMFSWCEVIKN